MNKIMHSVLGTVYEVLFGDREELHMSDDNMGECRVYGKKVLVCTESGDCSKEELEVRTTEIIAHEIFHAYANEAGLDLDNDTEEMVAIFFMKNWKKMSDSILALDKSRHLTEQRSCDIV